jgi:hypothetical protein
MVSPVRWFRSWLRRDRVDPVTDTVYDDGSTVEVTTPVDDLPSGEYVDHEEFFENLTPEELAEGERLGRETEDSGL